MNEEESLRILDNELMAEFVGFTQLAPNGSFWRSNDLLPGEKSIWSCKDLKFDQSADWLLLAINKLEDMGYSLNLYNETIFITRLNESFEQMMEVIAPYPKDVKDRFVKNVFSAIVLFIKKYNESKG